MSDIYTVKDIYRRNYGSEKFFKRDYYDNLIYTEGIMDFQKTMNACWLIDLVIQYLPTVIETTKAVDDGFFVARIKVYKNSSGYFEIYREGYAENEYKEHITVVKQNIPFIDLPEYTYNFYLVVSDWESFTYTFLLPSEY